MSTRKKFNTMWAGFIPGLILPLLLLVVLWVLRSSQDLKSFILTFQRAGNLAKVLALGGLPNLLLFYVFIWTRRSFAARGVILATLILAAVTFVLKFT